MALGTKSPSPGNQIHQRPISQLSTEYAVCVERFLHDKSAAECTEKTLKNYRDHLRWSKAWITDNGRSQDIAQTSSCRLSQTSYSRGNENFEAWRELACCWRRINRTNLPSIIETEFENAVVRIPKRKNN